MSNFLIIKICVNSNSLIPRSQVEFIHYDIESIINLRTLILCYHFYTFKRGLKF